ncbi:cytokinin hydroxylase-like [Miscanthus floridulus]|uniref:cytokinin hydroxylase-like n=1 Tax=Miscanthus floridulus TaxID=154761 RepID=UPI00345B137D
MDAVAAATGGAMAMAAAAVLLLCAFIYAAWLAPAAARRRLRGAGFDGPRPSFPFGNLPEITASLQASAAAKKPSSSSAAVSSDIHGAVFPYFVRWRESFGKVFVYWLGTEPFLYVANPEFLKAATAGALGKRWGKPDVFRRDRMPMFGRGLVMAEGDEWARHRHIIAPAFSATNLNDMIGLMQETTAKMLAEWTDAVASSAGGAVVDVERGVVRNAAEIIAKASFGVADDEAGARVFRKLQAMQAMLFQSNRLVGVPLARLLHVRKTYDAWRLGREIDALLMEIIDARRRRRAAGSGDKGGKDLLSLLLAGTEATAGAERRLTTRELVDECKTFFFGGHETTALALSWTLLMLAAHPDWQDALREEVARELGDHQNLDAAALGRLTKMGWVMSEVLRLYPPSPNVQRQALEDVAAEGKSSVVIPRGTNMWVDVVAMHHDVELWGADAHEFRPERFGRDPVQGGCRHRMGFLPFGFGGRICVGRNLTAMEYRVVLAMLLRRFRVSVAPEYRHAPKIMLSLRPSNGIQLHLTPLVEVVDHAAAAAATSSSA